MLGATKIYISNDERKIRKAKQIDNSGIYYETNLSANNIVSLFRDLLVKMQLDTEDFDFSLPEFPFDINNEETWTEGKIPDAKLFYYFAEDLIVKSKIDIFEIEKLKTKKSTKSLFPAFDNPTFIDNMGDSWVKRCKATLSTIF